MMEKNGGRESVIVGVVLGVERRGVGGGSECGGEWGTSQCLL
jgi:hypothetical protein